MDSSFKGSDNSSVYAHIGYSSGGFPFEQGDLPVSLNPDPGGPRESAGYITPIANPQEQRTDQWVHQLRGKSDRFENPFTAAEPNGRKSGPAGGRDTNPTGRFPHIRPGRGISGSNNQNDHWDDIVSANDPRFYPSGGCESIGREWGGNVFQGDLETYATIDDGSLHGTYDNSWYSPSPPPNCCNNQSDVASYLSIHPDEDTLRDQVSLSLCLCVCVCVCLPARLSVYHSVCLSVCLSLSMPIHTIYKGDAKLFLSDMCSCYHINFKGHFFSEFCFTFRNCETSFSSIQGTFLPKDIFVTFYLHADST